MPKLIYQGTNQAYVGIFQLRSINQDVVLKAANRVRDVCYEHAKEKGVWKIIEQKTGLDIYISNKTAMSRLFKQLPKIYGGYVKTSTKLVTKSRQTGKELRRFIVAFHMFPYEIGDVIVVDGKVIKISGFSKKLTGVNLGTGKRVRYDFDVKVEKLEVLEAQVSTTSPSLTLIHPETFQQVSPENEPSKKQTEYKVAIYMNKIYLIN